METLPEKLCSPREEGARTHACEQSPHTPSSPWCLNPSCPTACPPSAWLLPGQESGAELNQNLEGHNRGQLPEREVAALSMVLTGARARVSGSGQENPGAPESESMPCTSRLPTGTGIPWGSWESGRLGHAVPGTLVPSAWSLTARCQPRAGGAEQLWQWVGMGSLPSGGDTHCP